MKLGYRRDLQESDLYEVTSSEESEALGLRLQVEWQKELDKLSGSKENKGTPSLSRAIMRVFGKEFVILAFPAFLEECVFKYCLYYPVTKLDGNEH